MDSSKLGKNKKYSKKFNKRKGLSLIELVVSVAILGVVAIAILQLFGSGFVNIVGAGNHSKAQYLAQDVIEQDLNDRTITSTSNTMQITLHDRIISVTGDIKTEQADIGRGSVSVEYFKPSK